MRLQNDVKTPWQDIIVLPDKTAFLLGPFDPIWNRRLDLLQLANNNDPPHLFHSPGFYPRFVRRT